MEEKKNKKMNIQRRRRGKLGIEGECLSRNKVRRKEGD